MTRSHFLNPLDQLNTVCVTSRQYSFCWGRKVGPFTRYPNYLHPPFSVVYINVHINGWIYSATFIKSYLGTLLTPFLFLSLLFYCGCLNTLPGLSRSGSSRGRWMKFRLIIESDTEVSPRASGWVSNSIKSKQSQTGPPMQAWSLQASGKREGRSQQSLACILSTLPGQAMDSALALAWQSQGAEWPSAPVTLSQMIHHNWGGASSRTCDTHRWEDSSFVLLSVSHGIQGPGGWGAGKGSKSGNHKHDPNHFHPFLSLEPDSETGQWWG